MDIDVYKQRVIELFKSGEATDAQWEEMAAAVLLVSEDMDFVPRIDATIMTESEDENPQLRRER